MGLVRRDQRKSNVGIERRGLMDALNASQALVWFDGAGAVVDANDNALRLFGFAANEILMQDYVSLCGFSSKEQLSNKREWNSIAAGELCHTERSYVANDGEEIWSSVNFAALLNQDGSTRRVVAIFIDMSRFAWKPKDVRWAVF